MLLSVWSEKVIFSVSRRKHSAKVQYFKAHDLSPALKTRTEEAQAVKDEPSKTQHQRTARLGPYAARSSLDLPLPGLLAALC